MTKTQWRRIFANRILQRLGELNMTQTKLAAKAGLESPALSCYLNCKRTPNACVIANIARALGVTSAYLIDVDELIV